MQTQLLNWFMTVFYENPTMICILLQTRNKMLQLPLSLATNDQTSNFPIKHLAITTSISPETQPQLMLKILHVFVSIKQ